MQPEVPKKQLPLLGTDQLNAMYRFQTGVHSSSPGKSSGMNLENVINNIKSTTLQGQQRMMDHAMTSKISSAAKEIGQTLGGIGAIGASYLRSKTNQ